MAAADNNYGYLIVVLCKDGKHRTRKVHRLVAETYIPNPEGKREVDHIDNNRKNNCIQNLRWVTSAENKIDVDAHAPKCFSRIRCVETGKIYKNCADAARDVGVHRYAINSCVNGKSKTSAGYHWERVKE